MLSLAIRSALAVSILAREVQWTAGSVLADNTRETPVLLGADGNELRKDALIVFRLSTDGEAEDGNILEQHWDTTRADSGIAPILGNHRLGVGMEFGLGNWRNLRVVTVGKGRELLGDADYDMGDPVAAAVEGKVRRGYLRSTSVGWRPGGKQLRGDLPKDHPRYRAPQTDDCGTRVEGYLMGTEGDPNRFIEASMTPIPSDPGATQVDGRLARGALDVESLARGERVSGIDLGGALLALRGRPGVREWARSIVSEEMRTPEGRALLRTILAESSAPPSPPAERLLADLFRS